MAQADRTSAAGASVWEIARKSGYRTWPAEDVRDRSFAETLRSEGVDLVLNVHSLYIVHAAVLASARLGWYNLHPGPLPRYAGLDVVSWAIYRGEQEHGVTLHRMAGVVDSGPIAYQEHFPISADDTGLSLSAKCVRAGIGLVLRLVDTLADDPTAVPEIVLDPTKIRYFRRRGGITIAGKRSGVDAFGAARWEHELATRSGAPPALHAAAVLLYSAGDGFHISACRGRRPS